MSYGFLFDERLGISLPKLQYEWEDYSDKAKEEILGEWEKVRGTIPDRIKEIEQLIMKKQTLLNEEEDFIISCQINAEISELASIINDLWIWFRTRPNVHVLR